MKKSRHKGWIGIICTKPDGEKIGFDGEVDADTNVLDAGTVTGAIDAGAITVSGTKSDCKEVGSNAARH